MKCAGYSTVEPGGDRLRAAMWRQIALRLAAAGGPVTGGETAIERGMSGVQARRWWRWRSSDSSGARAADAAPGISSH